MVIKNSQSMLHSTSNMEPSKAHKLDLTYGKHVPRSVCDTERDRRQHKDPLKEEEMQ